MSTKCFVGLMALMVVVSQLPAEEKAKEPEWKPLFNGKNLDGWKSTKFGGEGEVEVKDGVIVLNTGSDMTGITFTGKMPKSNYELLIEAQRLESRFWFSSVGVELARSVSRAFHFP